MSNITHGVEQATISAGNHFTFYGALTGFLGWLASINWIGLAGFMVAFGGFAVSAYFQFRKNRREEAARAEESQRNAEAERRARELHDMQMIKIRQDIERVTPCE